jgi:hypothetical protein
MSASLEEIEELYRRDLDHPGVYRCKPSEAVKPVYGQSICP